MLRFSCMVLALVVCSVPVRAQTEYTTDGVPSGVEEENRWFLNRARFSPPDENTRMGTAYSVATGPLQPLAPHQLLLLSAEHHSEDMAKTDIFQHDTPIGTLYYVAGWSAGQRMTAEGYPAGTWGENIAAGYSTGEAAYNAWWNSSGHRNNMLSTSYREVGIGYYYWASSLYRRYYTQNFSTQNGKHFVTGVLFHDSNANAGYDDGEGVGGVTIELEVGWTPFSWYDVSTAAGSFAIPIDGITDGEAVDVYLENNTGSDVTLSIPRGFDTLETVTIGDGTRWQCGWYTQPGTVSNIGFRDFTAGKRTTTGHAVPLTWLEAQNSAWAADFESAATTDHDGDGILTWEEYWSGTDPRDATSHLKITTIYLSGTNVVLEWQHKKVDSGIPPIAIYRTDDLASGTWSYIGEKVPVEGTNSWQGSRSAIGFYRICATNAP